ncbi:MAG: hypothetical protein NTU62_05930 [Spirochaetes bacterium]|nr:hypothetical protein [Spirochaetota bacterium]
MKRKWVLALLAAVIFCVPGFGATLSTDELEVHVGFANILNLDPVNGGPSPFAGVIGASSLLSLDVLPDPWVLGAGVDLFGTWYEYSDGRAVPSTYEWGGSFFTVGLLLSPRIGARFDLTEALAAGAHFGLDLLIRFPLDPFSKTTTLADDRLPALGWFLAGRFLYPETGAWLTWQATKDVELAFTVRALWPVFRIWSGEGLPFFDQFILAGTLGATIRLGKPVANGKKQEEPAAPEASGEPASP